MKQKFKNVLVLVLALLLMLQPLTSYAAQPAEEPGETDATLLPTNEPGETDTTLPLTNEPGETDTTLPLTSEPGETDATPQLTNLPVVYITTEDNEEITSKDYYLNATLVIRDGDDILYNGATEIKGRGNSTWGLPKKPYKLKLDKKTNLFDMGKNKHWVLLANFFDVSLMRNKLSYDLSGAMGMDQMESVWVDVVLNGKFIGNYQLCEHIRVGDERVEITDWENITADVAEAIADVEGLEQGALEDYMNENMAWITSGSLEFNETTYYISDYYTEPIDISGGYLLELDEGMDEISKFYTAYLYQPIMLKMPEFLATNQDMMSYLQTYLNTFESAILNNATFDASYDNETVHYTDLFDMDSLIDYWLVQELFFNEDGMKKSTYLHKDMGEPMKMGPVWDMDWAAGADQSAAKPYNQWQTKYFNMNAQKEQWYKYIVQDSYFLIKARERYFEIRDTLIEDMIKDGGTIDQYITYLNDSAEKNDERWHGPNAFNSESLKLKNWLINRVHWLDAQFETKETLFNSLVGIKESSESLTLQLEDGTILEKGGEVDGILPENSSLKVSVSSAKSGYGLFINSRLYTRITDGSTSVTIPYDEALLLNDEANVITVKYLLNGYYDNSEVLTATYTNGEALPVITSIQCIPPSKTEYQLDEAWDTTGLKVEALMSDGNIVDVTQSAVLSGFDSSSAGKKTITVTYGNFTTSFDVFVLADTSSLTKAIEDAEKLDSENYTETSWKTFNDALTAAKAVLANKNASQEEVNQAVENLKLAKTQLIGTSSLTNAIKDAEKHDSKKYTEASWKTFNDALTAAKAVLANKNASQEDIVQALNKLNLAMANLENKKEPENPPKNPGNSGNNSNDLGSSSDSSAQSVTTAPTNTSDNSTILIWMLLGLISAISFAVIKRRQEF